MENEQALEKTRAQFRQLLALEEVSMIVLTADGITRALDEAGLPINESQFSHFRDSGIINARTVGRGYADYRLDDVVSAARAMNRMNNGYRGTAKDLARELKRGLTTQKREELFNSTVGQAVVSALANMFIDD